MALAQNLPIYKVTYDLTAAITKFTENFHRNYKRLKRLQFLDVLQEEASQAGDDAPALFEATFLLYTNELGDLITDLVAALGGLQED
jgi:DNA recombination-dependent growth factor C